MSFHLNLNNANFHSLLDTIAMNEVVNFSLFHGSFFCLFIVAPSLKVHQPFRFTRSLKRLHNTRTDRKVRRTRQPLRRHRCQRKMLSGFMFPPPMTCCRTRISLCRGSGATTRSASAPTAARLSMLNMKRCRLRGQRQWKFRPSNRLPKTTKHHHQVLISSNRSNITITRIQIKPFTSHRRRVVAR